jgi:hypothetical protein
VAYSKKGGYIYSMTKSFKLKTAVVVVLCGIIWLVQSVLICATPIPSVLENNIAKMEKIKDYRDDPKFVLDYISTDPTESNVCRTLEQIDELAKELTKGKKADYEKISAFAYYVSENIYYDFDAAHNDVSFDVICLQNVLERKRTTCAGFANLFSALCNSVGIKCVNMRGATPEGAYTKANLDDPEAPINHEWTAAYLKSEDRWVYVDATWNSRNRYQNGAFNYSPSVKTYFDMTMSYMSTERCIRTVEYRNFKSALTAFVPEPTATQTSQSTSPVQTTQTSQTSWDSEINTDTEITVKSEETASTSASVPTKKPADTHSTEVVGNFVGPQGNSRTWVYVLGAIVLVGGGAAAVVIKTLGRKKA